MPLLKKIKYFCNNCGWSETVFRPRLKHKMQKVYYYCCPDCHGGIHVKKIKEEVVIQEML